jgi:predicted RNase H-like HicB family nuclease
MKIAFLVVYEKGKKNYGSFAPDVPGCGSMGETLEEMRANLREALELYMETSIEFGYALPEPKTQTVTLPIEGETDPKTSYVVEHLTISVTRPRKSRPRAAKTRTTVITKRRALQTA